MDGLRRGKGSLHTDELMGAVVAADSGLRTDKRMSHCFLIEAQAYPRPFILIDAAVNIAPDRAQKAAITQNAIDVAHALGVACPLAAWLAQDRHAPVLANQQATLSMEEHR